MFILLVLLISSHAKNLDVAKCLRKLKTMYSEKHKLKSSFFSFFYGKKITELSEQIEAVEEELLQNVVNQKKENISKILSLIEVLQMQINKSDLQKQGLSDFANVLDRLKDLFDEQNNALQLIETDASKNAQENNLSEKINSIIKIFNEFQTKFNELEKKGEEHFKSKNEVDEKRNNEIEAFKGEIRVKINAAEVALKNAVQALENGLNANSVAQTQQNAFQMQQIKDLKEQLEHFKNQLDQQKSFKDLRDLKEQLEEFKNQLDNQKSFKDLRDLKNQLEEFKAQLDQQKGLKDLRDLKNQLEEFKAQLDHQKNLIMQIASVSGSNEKIIISESKRKISAHVNLSEIEERTSGVNFFFNIDHLFSYLICEEDYSNFNALLDIVLFNLKNEKNEEKRKFIILFSDYSSLLKKIVFTKGEVAEKKDQMVKLNEIIRKIKSQIVEFQNSENVEKESLKAEKENAKKQSGEIVKQSNEIVNLLKQNSEFALGLKKQSDEFKKQSDEVALMQEKIALILKQFKIQEEVLLKIAADVQNFERNNMQAKPMQETKLVEKEFKKYDYENALKAKENELKAKEIELKANALKIQENALNAKKSVENDKQEALLALAKKNAKDLQDIKKNAALEKAKLEQEQKEQKEKALLDQKEKALLEKIAAVSGKVNKMNKKIEEVANAAEVQAQVKAKVSQEKKSAQPDDDDEEEDSDEEDEIEGDEEDEEDDESDEDVNEGEDEEKDDENVNESDEKDGEEEIESNENGSDDDEDESDE